MEMKVSQVGYFQITGCWICYCIFSDISFIVFFTRLCQKYYEETILFQLTFHKSISRCSILLKIKISNFVILKWQPFEGKKLKNLSIFGTVSSEIKNVDILNFSWIKQFGNYFSFLKKWHIWVCYCWNCRPSNLKAELKTDFWLQIGIANYPRYGSGQLPPTNS